MVDANEEFVSMPYTYYKGEEGPVEEDVDVLQRRQLDSTTQPAPANRIGDAFALRGNLSRRDEYQRSAKVQFSLMSC